MNTLAQRVAAFEIARETPRKRLDRGDLRAEAHIPDLRDKRRAARHELARATSKLGERATQRWRRLRRIQHLHRGSMRGKRIERHIDAVETPIILRTVLQVIDKLERRA